MPAYYVAQDETVSVDDTISFTVNKPAADLGTLGISAAQVVSAVQGIFDRAPGNSGTGLPITITSVRPATGPYSEVYVGGTATDMRSTISSPSGSLIEGLIGEAAFRDGINGTWTRVDFGNVLRDDKGFVFSGNDYYRFVNPDSISRELLTSADSLQRLAATIAHEIGHGIGAVHVNDPDELMFPRGICRTDTLISDAFLTLAEGRGKSCEVSELDATANNYRDLANGLGLFNSESTGFLKLRLSLAELGGALHSPHLAIQSPSDDTLPTLFAFGDGTTGSEFELEIEFSRLIGSRVTLFGSSTQGGPLDVFSVLPSEDLINVTAEDLTFGLLGSAMSVQDARVEPIGLALFRVGGSNEFSQYGVASLAVPSFAVPEPNSLRIMFLGLLLLGMSMRRKRGPSFGL